MANTVVVSNNLYTVTIDNSDYQVVITEPGPQGPPGAGFPTGGTTDQVLAKLSNTNYDTTWKTLTKSDVGLSNVDNTSDLNKPISTATQAALDLLQANSYWYAVAL